MKLFASLTRRRAATLAAFTASAALPVALLAPLAGGAANASPAPVAPQDARYIVMTQGDPLASYTGGVKSFTRTKPKAGDKLATRTANARGYAKHLEARHDAVLRAAGISTDVVRDEFTTAFNGFVAELSPGEAAVLQKQNGVAQVWEDEVRTADTITTPDFLGLTGDNGVWRKRFGGVSKAGEGMIIGVLDSGIWPENPMFAALPTPRPDQAVIDEKWNGTCVAGEDPNPADRVTCNNKLIGARYYPAGNTIRPEEYLSPRDFNGHGSHTSSTAGGNNNVTAVINGVEVGKTSGMAPAARLAMYKVLWQNATGGSSGNTSGIVAAINDAVADGVDVISYSISGSRTSIVSPDEIAFLNATLAGVFVSTSAGNDGVVVGRSSVAHNSPWEMTTAASSHDRGNSAKVNLGNGTSYTGVGVNDTGVPAQTPLISSTAAKAAAATEAAANLCFSSTWPGGPGLDPALVAGKIVVCTRGTNDRVDKSRAVKEAGGVGMVLANASPAESLNGDFHVIPTVHVNSVDGAAIKAYAATAGATASISPRDPTPVRAPEMAGFSSWGPALAGGGDLLKPDVTAPGVDVIAAVSKGNGGNDFNALSGTSMSTPHVSGIAALIMQAHPSWSPTWVKSALMTTATNLDKTGQPIQRAGKDATPIDFGNGHIVPGEAFDPGLVYDAGLSDWIRYGCSINQFQAITAPGTCESAGAMDPSDLNYPSISVADLAGSQTITRSVTNTSTDQASQYKPTVVAPPGFTATVSPSKMTVPPQQSRSFKVTLTRVSAPFDQWAYGSLTWTDKRGHAARSSIAVESASIAAPSEVTESGTSGSETLSLTAGFSGTLTTSVGGLVAAQVDTRPTTLPVNTEVIVTVPGGTQHARFATYDADYPANTDVDLAVFRGTTQVGNSGGATAEEAVNLVNPPAGDYRVVIDYFAGTPSTLDVKLNSFVLGTTAAGNLTATPVSQPVTVGEQADVTLAWSGLTAGTRYLGAVTYGDGTSTVGRTLVSVLP